MIGPPQTEVESWFMSSDVKNRMLSGSLARVAASVSRKVRKRRCFMRLVLDEWMMNG